MAALRHARRYYFLVKVATVVACLLFPPLLLTSLITFHDLLSRDLKPRERTQTCLTALLFMEPNQANKTKDEKNMENGLLSMYNVTPDATWLKKFYRLDSTMKRKSLFDFPFIINGANICSMTPNPFLVIMVLSVHTNIDIREAIRNTWGRSANSGAWPKVGLLREQVKLVFLFGRGNTTLKDSIILTESKTRRDIVQADFVDSYFNLTYKVATGIRWVAQFCPGAKYILKADDDVFIHVHNLIKVLKKVSKPDSTTFYGHVYYNATVRRTGRWEVEPRLFPFPVYPTYASGGSYIIPGSKIMELYIMAGYFDYLNLEDVFITGILRTIIGFDIQNVVGFTHWYEKKPIPCEFKNSVRISATKVTKGMQYDIWEGLKSNIANCYKV